MKMLLASLLALSTVLSVHAVSEQPCGGSVSCTCDPAKYNSSAIPPIPTVNCSNGQMTIYISKCQLEKSRFNTSNLSLINNTGSDCSSKDYSVDGEVQVGFHNPVDSAKCGNKIIVNITHVTYSNILSVYPSSIFRGNYTFNLSCVFPLNYEVALNISLKPKIGSTEISVPGAIGQIKVTMAVFTDPAFSVPVTDSTVILVEDTVYIQVWIPDLQANTFALKVVRLYATPGATDPGTGLLFNLTSGTDGCPDPQYGVGLISVLQNGNSSVALFAMKVFKITGQDYVNLYADVTICTPACVVSCTQKLEISSEPNNVASVKVELTAEDSRISGASDRFSLSWTLVSLISSLLFVKFM